MQKLGGLNQSWFPVLWGQYPNGARLFCLPGGVLFSLLPQFGKELEEVERLKAEVARVVKQITTPRVPSQSLPMDSRLKSFDKDERPYWAQRLRDEDELHEQYLENQKHEK